MKYKREFLHTSIVIENRNGCITISAVFSSPKHAIEREYYIIFFKTRGNRFIAAEDYNAKHTRWRSKLILYKEQNYSK
jgi:hypothetical protein